MASLLVAARRSVLPHCTNTNDTFTWETPNDSGCKYIHQVNNCVHKLIS